MPEEQVKKEEKLKEEKKNEKLIKGSTGQKHILYASDKGEAEDKDKKDAKKKSSNLTDNWAK